MTWKNTTKADTQATDRQIKYFQVMSANYPDLEHIDPWNLSKLVIRKAIAAMNEGRIDDAAAICQATGSWDTRQVNRFIESAIRHYRARRAAEAKQFKAEKAQKKAEKKEQKVAEAVEVDDTPDIEESAADDPAETIGVPKPIYKRRKKKAKAKRDDS